MAKWWPFGGRKQEQIHVQLTPESMWHPRGDHSLRGSEAVFGAVTMLSNTIASMHVHLYHGWEEAVDHPLHRLLCYRPSPRMSPYTFWQSMETCRDTAGNCYALMVPGVDGEIESLDVINPSAVTVRMDEDTGELWYELRPEGGQPLYVPGSRMLHCRHVSAGGDMGVSPLDVLRDTLDYNNKVQALSLVQLRGINGAIVLEIPSDMSAEHKKRVVEEFMNTYRQSANSLMVLGGGAKASKIERSVVDAKIMDTDRITVSKVARVYNIPPTLLGDYTTSSYSSQEQQQLEYLERTVIPIIRMYESELTSKLLSYKEFQSGYRFAFDVTDLIVADAEARSNMAQVYVRNGLKCVNEIRAEIGLKPIAGGDTLFVSRDLVPLGDAATVMSGHQMPITATGHDHA